MATGALRSLASDVRRDLEPLPTPERGTALFAEGLEWLRTSTPANSLIVSRIDAMLVSVLTERRMFFETARYSAAEHRSKASGGTTMDAGIQRVQRLTRARSDVFRAPSEAHLRAVRAAAGDVRELLFVWDDSRPSPEGALGEFEFGTCDELPADARAYLGAPLFSNEVMRIYAIPPREKP